MPTRSAFVSEMRATVAVAGPLAAANLAQMAMGFTNTVIVGSLGSAALAAAGLGASLYFTIAMVCSGILTAVAPLAAHAIGAGDNRRAGLVAGSCSCSIAGGTGRRGLANGRPPAGGAWL